MLQQIRDRARGIGGWIILGAIVFVLSVFGFGAFNVFVGGEPTVASVGSREITESELARRVEQRRRSLLARMGEDADPAQIDEVALRRQVLESMIARSLLLEAADAANMGAPSEVVERTITSMEQFRSDGRFDPDRYRFALSNAGMTPAQFQQALGEDLRIQHLVSGISDTALATEDRLHAVAALMRQRRDVAWLRFDAAAAAEEIEVEDAAAREYYDAHPSRYRTPERVKIRYLRLSKAALADEVEVTEAELRGAYREEREAWQGQEQRRASHILIETGDARSPEAARELARELRERLEAGADFAELAEAYSDDAGSARRGGDLGYGTRDAYEPAFADALWALEQHEVSEPVTTDFGVHLIRLEAVTRSDPPSFEAMRPELVERVRARKADERFTELKRELETLAYEAPDLEEPANALGLEIQTAGPFSADGGEAPITQREAVIDAAFSEEVLADGYNSPLLEPEPGTAAVLRVSEHLPERLQPFEAVAEEVRAALRRERAVERVAERGRAALEELRQGRSTGAVADAYGLAWERAGGVRRDDRSVPGAVLDAAFTLPRPRDGKSLGSARLPDDDFTVIAVTAVEDGSLAELTDAQRRSLARTLQTRTGGAELEAVRAVLRERFPIDRAER